LTVERRSNPQSSRRGLEPRSIGRRQRQRGSKLLDGIFARRQIDAALQVANATDAQPRTLCQLLLGQTGRGSVALEQRRES
jgi:hypothetical protein